ncbi:uncharacterized protein LOC108415057 isoform X1 [Pygocentrus nattereri]|uniref:uncharacterized protein LOC108415057 isoform X1 n=2 Tax=Pygocentrus nattereri TaxID=42514 RepID=UPI001891B47F|nr:uncharacterized protein LOC108415057 isoform X1 [Pygocentrus nattereri]XP_037392917.1 uncharacterized protein LOC108415057 isoform X1 [Pygocentrus nattereri]XP_037392918.1 uncharacterized protein LOC108415057 isoform X1 [Pygocentrus nattereri]XP_037392919.1 uncharacterized protein LOC108415057 isoform X1 [Pygocentrus nattereri]
MKQIAFNMRRVLCIILLLPAIKTYSPNSVLASVQFVPAGSTVKIPCDGYGDHTTGRWLYRRKNENFQTIARESKGLVLTNKTMLSRKKILKNFHLEISAFTELDEGIYACQVCTHTSGCTDGEQISLLLRYETSSTSSRTHFIIEGGRLNYSCLCNLTLKVGWTFQAHGENAVTNLNSESTDKTLLIIPDVRPSHAGKYSCWRETVTGKRHTVYAVTLCVFTVTAVELTDSPQNCNLYCDVDVNAMGNPVTVVADKWNISITGIMKKPKSSVICRLHSRGVETDRLHLADESTTQSDATAFITAGSNTSQAVTLIITCTAAPLIIVALGIILCVLRRQVNTGRNSTRGGQTMTKSSGDEDETQVVYSMLDVGRHQQQNVITSDNECVYSQIKV